MLPSLALVNILIGVLAATLVASAQPARGWSVTVPPPRPDLPAVAVELGYPGGYVSRDGSPIELRALGGTRFDGYIGYHFEVDGNRTVDPAVAAKMPRLQSTVRLRMFDIGLRPAAARTLVLDWRDGTGRALGQANAGVPPWSDPRPARITTSNEPAPLRRHFDLETVFLDVSQLSTSPGWYAGFHSLIFPVTTWLSLPVDVKSAIFSSGAQLITFGLPAPGALLSPIDDAVLPVTFDAAGAHPKPREDYAASTSGPRFVGSKGVSWAASEEILASPLPATNAFLLAKPTFDLPLDSWRGRIVAFLREVRIMLLLAVAVIASVLACVFVRRGATIAVCIGASLLIAAHPLYRDTIRRRSERRTIETWRANEGPRSIHSRDVSAYGDSPLHPQLTDAAWNRTATFLTPGSNPAPRWIELTPDGVPIQFDHSAPWAEFEQAGTRRESGSPVKAHVDSISDRSLSFRYEIAERAASVYAGWTFRGRYYFGNAELPAGGGRVTISADRSSLNPHWDLSTFPMPRITAGESVELRFEAGTRAHTRRLHWIGSVAQRGFLPYFMTAPVIARPDGTLAASFLIPEGGIPRDGFIAVGGSLPEGAILEGAGQRIPLAYVEGRARVTVADFRRVAREHDIVTVIMRPDPLVRSRHDTAIVLRFLGNWKFR